MSDVTINTLTQLFNISTDEANKIAEINNKYDSLIQQEKQKKEALIKEMLNKEFLLSFPDVNISVGNFQVEADPQHFPATVISEKTELDYYLHRKLQM